MSDDVLLYFADKFLDFQLAILAMIIGHFIDKWLNGRK